MGFISIDLDELRSKANLGLRKQPFDHQIDAFHALRETFGVTDAIGRGRSAGAADRRREDPSRP